MPKKSNGVGSIYWHRNLDEIIDQYNKSDDRDEREILFRKHLHQPLDKMAENIINTFKFPYIDGNFEELKQEVVSLLVMNLSKYKIEKGSKSFSYLSVIAKNYLIGLNSKDYKREKRSIYLSDTQNDSYISLEELTDLQTPMPDETGDDMKEFIKLEINFWEKNIELLFKKKKESDIAYSIIDLLRNVEKLENFNKKALYLMIRDIGDCKTSNVTKVVNKMRMLVMKHLNEYRAEGIINDL